MFRMSELERTHQSNFIFKEVEEKASEADTCLAELGVDAWKFWISFLRAILIMADRHSTPHRNHRVYCSPYFTKEETEPEVKRFALVMRQADRMEQGVLLPTQQSLLFLCNTQRHTHAHIHLSLSLWHAYAHMHYLPCTWNTKLQP